MTASAEVCRFNGRKSRGNDTGQNASGNATKHGLLSERPPLVMGETWALQGIVQGLIDEYAFNC